MYRLLTCLSSEHDLRIVMLAVMVCASSVAMTFKIYGQSLRVQDRKMLWIGMTGLTAGCGIWATHFIAMLAYLPAIPTSYATGLTISSLVIAVITAIAGFWLAHSGRKRSALIGGAVIGTGIASMHSSGMKALRLLHKPIRREELIGAVFDLVKDLPLHEGRTHSEAETMLLDTAGNAAGIAARDGAGSSANRHGPHSTQPTISPSARRALGLRVLVAEDNPVNQIVASEYLESLGCFVMSVENGREALEALAKDYFDVVLMDCQMPEMDGLSATRAIRERERATGCRPMPIIAVTANAYEEDRQKTVDAGMDGYLSKPITEGDLERALRQWCPLPPSVNTVLRPA